MYAGPLGNRAFRVSHVARKAAIELVAMRLCPQACPMPGRASYSALNATTRPPVPWEYSISKAVSKP